MTIETVLQNGALLLKKAGIEQPRFEAEVLLAACLKEDRVFCYAHGGDELTPDQQAVFDSGIMRRAVKEPMAYILGEKAFMGLKFCVSPAVLIPRPDTEILVESALELMEENQLDYDVLDLCAGSGAIGLSLAVYRPGINLTLSDISNAALEIAAVNAKRFYPPARLLQGDLFEPVENEKFDLILSNPPYIPSAVIETLDRDVQDYEPHLALDGGETGFDCYDRILQEARLHLKNGGWLLLEAGDGQGEMLLNQMQISGFSGCFAKKDLIGMPRCIGGQFFEK